MILSVYAVRDDLSGFLTPTFEQNDAIAMRNFQMATDSARRDSTLLGFRPSDFTLYKIATFDSDSGVISPLMPVELIMRGTGGNDHA